MSCFRESLPSFHTTPSTNPTATRPMRFGQFLFANPRLWRILSVVPLLYTVDHALRRVHQIGSDPISATDVFSVQDQQVEDVAWSYSTLVDFTRVAWVPSSADMRRFMTHVGSISKALGPRGPVAMVAGENTALFGMFRMYSILGEPGGAIIEAFSSVSDAEHWLSHGR